MANDNRWPLKHGLLTLMQNGGALLRLREGRISHRREIKLIAASQLFDENWYLEKNGLKGNAIRHYVAEGARQGLSPHPLFDVPFYSTNRNLSADNRITPLTHFILENGQASTPHPLFDPEWYAKRHPYVLSRDKILFRDYLLRGAIEGLSPHPLFDVDWYREQVPGLVENRINPLTHFIESGAAQNRDPNRFFSVKWYRHTYGALLAQQANPLVHYATVGHRQRLQPSPLVNLDLYRREIPGVPADDLAAVKQLILQDANRYLSLVDAKAPGLKVLGSGETETERSGQAPRIETPTVDQISPQLGHAEVALIASIARGRRLLEHSFTSRERLFDRAAAAYHAGAVDYRILGFGLPEDLAGTFAQLRKTQKLGSRPARGGSSGTGAAGSGWLPYWSERDNPSDFVIDADIYERDIRNKVGSVDAIVWGGGLQHEREPLRILRRLAWLASEYVVFYTTLVEPLDRRFGAERVHFTAQDMWPSSSLTAAQALTLDAYWRERGISLPQFDLYRQGDPWAFAPQDGFWWWFFGLESISRLVALAGLQLVDRAFVWGGRGIWFLARRMEGSD